MPNEYLLAKARSLEEQADIIEREVGTLSAEKRPNRLATIEGMRTEAANLRWAWRYGNDEFLKTPFLCVKSQQLKCGAPQFRRDGQLVCLANSRCTR